MSRIIGIGIDAVEVERVLKACSKESFINTCFTENEKQIIEHRKESAATNFAGKEAVSKAFGTGFSKFHLKDIEILRSKSGAPYVNLYNKAHDIANNLGIINIHISLTDTDAMAMAYVIAEGDD